MDRSVNGAVASDSKRGDVPCTATVRLDDAADNEYAADLRWGMSAAVTW